MSTLRRNLASVGRRVLGEGAYVRAWTGWHNAGRGLATAATYAKWAVGLRNRRRLETMRDSYAGRRCFVIGNGPSLGEMDLAPLRQEITIGSNCLFLLFEDIGFKPTFLTVEDRLVAEDRGDIISALRGATKVIPSDLAHFIRPDDDTVYIWFRRHYSHFPTFSPDLARTAFWGGTVTFLNLQLAYYIGCRDVYLIGVDHSYDIPDDADIAERGVITSRSADPNHFSPDYFGPGYRWHDPKVERMERSYVAAREFGATHHLRISNATDGGKLEVFPRVEYSEIIRKPEGGAP